MYTFFSCLSLSIIILRFIHINAWVSNLLLFIDEYYSTVRINHNLLFTLLFLTCITFNDSILVFFVDLSAIILHFIILEVALGYHVYLQFITVYLKVILYLIMYIE